MAVALLACGPGRTTFARYPGGAAAFDRAASDPKALAIADKVLAAAGGERWKDAKQLRWGQIVTNDGKEVIAGEQAWDRWNGRHHGRAKREDGDLVVMRSLYEEGGHAFIDNGERLRKIEDGTKEALAAAKERWEFDTAVLFMAFLLEEPGAKLGYEGELAGDDGKPRDVLKLKFDPKDQTRTATYFVAVNRDTNQIDRIEIQKAGKGDNERLGFGVKAWIDGGGMKVPGSLENLGLKGEVITFKDLTIGEPDETLFVPPL
jgi:hypothetical protein